MTSTTNAAPTTNAVTGALIDDASNAGKVFPYNSAAAPTELPGLRVVVKTFKQSEKMKSEGKEAKQNVYVRIPTAHITADVVTERIAELAPFVVSYLQGIEEKSIQDYLAKDGLQVFTNTLTLDKVIETILESGNTGLDGESITKWFNDVVAANLLVVLAAKMGTATEMLTEDQAAKASQVIQSYLALFISLASGKTMLSEKQRASLTKCLEVTSASDTNLGQRFISRFEKMAAKELESLNSLGDLEL